MKIAVDAMGSDNHPGPDVAGAVQAARELGVPILLVGQPDVIEAELARSPAGESRKESQSYVKATVKSKSPPRPEAAPLPIEIVPASEVIEMAEHPANAVKNKPDSSMVVGMKLVKEGRADAFVSMGNTGGMLAAGIFHLGRIRGVKRPALTATFPSLNGPIVVLDIGANADVKPEHLAQFALMGSLYAQRVLQRPSPRVGLVSNGEEESKGNEVVKEAHQLIKQLPRLNFIGNVEGRDIPLGNADVFVTDGFTGNVILKLAEGMGTMMRTMIREELRADPISSAGGLLARSGFERVAERLNSANYGGVLLLGLDGVAIVGHGSSNALAVKNAIRAAQVAVESNVVGGIREGLAPREAMNDE